MACGGCMGARRQFVQSARRLNITGAVDAVRQAARINYEKVRGTYNDANYTTPVVKAKPYRREPERTA